LEDITLSEFQEVEEKDENVVVIALIENNTLIYYDSNEQFGSVIVNFTYNGSKPNAFTC
jgi:hypothetical protein